MSIVVNRGEVLWKGTPIDEYSREELIDIINELGRMYHELILRNK